ncbi:MAG: uroporphyrinogen-III synthase, partial [Flavobacteriaceae bacterium]|nr:uroporphyrinogen-III synthase [Flavobacteriaceae bacterium]
MARLLSTKKLKINQKDLILNAGIALIEYNALKTENIPFSMPKTVENAIFSSKNAVNAVFPDEDVTLQTSKGSLTSIFCVGERTSELLRKKGQKIVKTANYGDELANFIVKNHKSEEFHFFCGNKRRDVIPETLKEAGISLFEIKTYETSLKFRQFHQNFDGILFFSPSGVESFINANASKYRETKAVCIGKTTAAAAKPHFDTVITANSTRIESVIAKA